MNNKERIENFMKEYEELCVRHGLSLGHEDYEGGFIIDEYDADNIEWVKAAMNGFELREKRQKEIEEIRERLAAEEKELSELLGDKTYKAQEGIVVNAYGEFVRNLTREEKDACTRIRMLKRGLTWRMNTKY